MRLLAQFAHALFRDRRAATAVEYGLILALIVLAMVAALGQFARATTGMWEGVREKVEGAR